jgi:hypothetical protein
MEKDTEMELNILICLVEKMVETANLVRQNKANKLEIERYNKFKKIADCEPEKYLETLNLQLKEMQNEK